MSGSMYTTVIMILTSGLMEMSYFPIFVYVNILKLLLEYIYIIFNAIALTYFYIQYKHHS